MPKIFSAYCALLIILLAFANYQGYVLASLFTGASSANKGANHYHK